MFSELKFQADMGKLLAFMFMVNMVMAMTALPAFAVWMERLFPRKGRCARRASWRIECGVHMNALPSRARFFPTFLAACLGTLPRGWPCPSAMPLRRRRCRRLRAAARGALGLRRAQHDPRRHPRGHPPDRGGERGWCCSPTTRARTGARPAKVPVDATLTAVSFTDDARQGWAVGHLGVILHSTDGGETWSVQRIDPVEDRPLFAVAFTDARNGSRLGCGR